MAAAKNNRARPGGERPIGSRLPYRSDFARWYDSRRLAGVGLGVFGISGGGGELVWGVVGFGVELVRFL